MSADAAQRERSTDLGVVRINNEAITTIASIAAMEVKGVHKMGGGINKTLGEIFFRKVSAGGVRVVMNENELKLIVSIVVEYGIDIPRTADAVQDNVKNAVEKMTGLILSGVDVIVDGVFAPSQYDQEKRRVQKI